MMLINRSIRQQQQQQQQSSSSSQSQVQSHQQQQQQQQQSPTHDAKRPKQKRNNSFTSSAFFQALQPNKGTQNDHNVLDKFKNDHKDELKNDQNIVSDKFNDNDNKAPRPFRRNTYTSSPSPTFVDPVYSVQPPQQPQHRNHHRKPSITKFNLGGLFKKKINQKRPSIDSITNNVTQINLNNNYDPCHYDEEPAYTTAPYSSSATTNIHPNSGACSTSSFNSNTSSATTGVTTADSSSPISLPVQQHHHLQTNSKHHHSSSNDTPRTEERYTSFTAECISLQNSEMTSHLDLDEVYDDNDAEADHHTHGHGHGLHQPFVLHTQSHSSSNLYSSSASLSAPSDPLSDSFDANLEESCHDYQPGGYHSVHLGDVLKSSSASYQVVRKLGWGHFSTVWLATNLSTHQYVAIKIVKSSRNYYEAAEDEIRILRLLNDEDDADYDDIYDDGKRRIMTLLDDFIIKGPHGTHIAMVFEVLGENILHLIYKYKREKISALHLPASVPSSPSIIPLNSIKSIVKQILLSVSYMHHRGVIHTDLKPENVLVKYQGNLESEVNMNELHNKQQHMLPSRPLTSSLDHCSLIKIADLGNATFANLHFTNQIQTRQYRSPEIIMKYKSWGSSTDLWSIGCIIFELITGDYLFDPHDGCNFDKDEDHLAQIFELLGELPSEEYLADCKLTPRFFSRDSSTHQLRLKNIRHLKVWKLLDVFVDKYKFDREDVNVLLVTDLILKCLRFELDDRYDCRSLLAHPWFNEEPTYDPAALAQLPNIHDDVPGYTSTWDVDDD